MLVFFLSIFTDELVVNLNIGVISLIPLQSLPHCNLID